MRRISGATSYYNRVTPANPAARTRQIERQEPKIYIDITSPDVKEINRINRQMDQAGQAITALVIAVGSLVLIYNLVRWLCGF
jgi:hypothetical protein